MRPRTRAIHGAYTRDPVTGASVAPIYQSTAFAYATAEDLADVFAGRAAGDVYSRISNPTTSILERRLTELESGLRGPALGCVATSSGMAAITAGLVGLLRAGDHILSADGIFGGTVSLFNNILGRFGVTTSFAEASNTASFAESIRDNTKLIFVETIGNPRMDVPDLPSLADLAHKHNVPLVVDSTLTPPSIVQTGRFGADIVIHSTSKFINGHGTAVGGALIDTGNYDWSNGVFPDVKQLSRRAGQLAFLAHLRRMVYRDLGGCPAPMNSFLMLQGLETLDPRMGLHCENALRLAEYLDIHPKVAWVNYPGLPRSSHYERVKRLFGGLAGGVLTFGLGDKARAMTFASALKLARNMTNLGDAKTLVLHPASTIFLEYEPDERQRMGVPEDMLRVSVGIEDFEDIKADFDQAIEAASVAASDKCALTTA